MEFTTALTPYADLIENPVARCACMLVLDVSSSMDGEPIRELNDGVQRFIAEIQEDEFASQAIELGIVTFGSRVNVTLPITPAHLITDVRPLEADGMTPMGEAVAQSMQALAARKAEYRQTGTSYYQPWLVLMSDGAPNDDWRATAVQCRSLSAERKLVVLPVGVGEGADLAILGQFSHRPAMPIAGLRFREFFQWLSASMSRVSQSTPGTGVNLPPTSGWDQI
ncbi:VWA domain-containing protein [Allochromatium humboldtianum]|uniref:VWA domain-containing protein n=1 Tax=Allochromatium humboldtianum TaxID=504901 RepID=A0A850RAA8_9GAMM|nr:VWA domain-containing protein [Allochromatium humboldtianum]NVZ08212.1 VWA domain-containing protein [Allochromatium humboldtianum]